MKRMTALCLMMLMIMRAAAAETISPITGLPIAGEPTAPMLAVISHSSANVKYNGHTTTAQGVGKRQAWGGQLADIIYECPMYKDAATRLTYLYHDAIVNGEKIEAGPIRSVRSPHVELTRQWSGGLIYGSGLSGNMNGVPELWEIREVAFTDGEDRGKPYITYLKNVRVPDHRSADVAAIHQLLEDQTFQADALVFTDELPGEHLPKAVDIKLNWGDEKKFFSRFVYEEALRSYRWYSNKVPMKNWNDAFRTEESEMFFQNVIVQYVPIGYSQSDMLPETDFSGSGLAQILMGGRMVEARWMNRNGRIHYVDENGMDIPLMRGKTYIAIWPYDQDKLHVK